MGNPTEDLNDCRSLFLTDIQETGFNSLTVIVSEGVPAGDAEAIEVGGVVIPNCTRIEPTDQSRVFELAWKSYVGYAVLNESFASVDDAEQFEGKRFRVYSKSHFLDYMSQATFACKEHPGPTQHYSVACEDHIIEVLSVAAPTLTRVR